MGQAPVDHLERDGGEWLPQVHGDLVGEVDQHGVEEPGDPDLRLDAVGRADPEIGQAQQAFDDGEGVLNPPAILPLKH